jgi:hypothetical protein
MWADLFEDLLVLLRCAFGPYLLYMDLEKNLRYPIETNGLC